MRYLHLAWVFVIMMVAVSAAFNFSFGWRLGEHSYTITSYVHDGWVYGMLSLAGDGLKVVMGVLAVMCITSSKIPAGLRALGFAICGVLFVCATLYSLNSAVGSVSTNRTDMAGIREAKATNYDAVKQQLDRAQKELSWLDQGYRASAAVEADLAGLRQSNLWARTAGCNNATVEESRTFCQRYTAFQAELGTSRRAEDLDAKVTALGRQLAGMGGAVIADPHAAMLNRLTGYEQPTIVLAWLLLVVTLVEGVSTFGPIGLAVAHKAIHGRQEASGAGFQRPLSLDASKFDPAYSGLSAAPRTPMKALEKIAGVEAPVSDAPKADVRKDITQPGEIAEKLSDTPTDDGPGTPAPAPEPVEPTIEEVMTPATAKVLDFYRKDNPNAEYRIIPDKKVKKERREHAEVKEFVRDRLGINQDALRAMKTAIKECKAVDSAFRDQLMDSTEVYDLYQAWCDDNSFTYKSPKAFSGDLWDHCGLPKGTRKMKGVKGLRNASGYRFPVYAKEFGTEIRRKTA
jgi:hypothetical protein